MLHCTACARAFSPRIQVRRFVIFHRRTGRALDSDATVRLRFTFTSAPFFFPLLFPFFFPLHQHALARPSPTAVSWKRWRNTAQLASPSWAAAAADPVGPRVAVAVALQDAGADRDRDLRRRLRRRLGAMTSTSIWHFNFNLIPVLVPAWDTV